MMARNGLIYIVFEVPRLTQQGGAPSLADQKMQKNLCRETYRLT